MDWEEREREWKRHQIEGLKRRAKEIEERERLQGDMEPWPTKKEWDEMVAEGSAIGEWPGDEDLR